MFKTKEYEIGSRISMKEALHFSLSIASKGIGLVEPNPCVGAVLFNEMTKELIAYGYHELYGGPHAEVNCLQNIEDAKNLTLIVTLEPCSHFGKTPPCADLVIDKNIKKLIYISRDPNPLVGGKGFEKIKHAGIEVEEADSCFKDKNEILNHKFFYAMRKNRTYVHLKWAESGDGKTAVIKGSPWITGSESKNHVHFLRAQSQAVLIGRKTLERDDPSLNVRLNGYEKSLKVIIFDPDLKTLSKIKLKNVYKVRKAENIIYLCKEIPKDFSSISFLKLEKRKDDKWDLKQLTKDLYKKFDVQSVLVEGGAETISEFIKQKIYNRVSKFKALHALGDNGIGEINDGLDSPVVSKQEAIGSDSFIDMYF